MFKSSVTVLLAFFLSLTFASPVKQEFTPWEGRILGGSEAAEGQIPYQARLRSDQGLFLCSGAIVNQRWIVSVARCLINRSQINTRVTVGSNIINQGALLFLLQMIVHENYNSNTFSNNIALVQTVTDIIYSFNVQPIFLNSVFLGGGVDVELSGWGQVSQVCANCKLKYLCDYKCNNVCSNQFIRF